MNFFDKLTKNPKLKKKKKLFFFVRVSDFLLTKIPKKKAKSSEFF